MICLEDGSKQRISGSAPRHCNTKAAARQALHDHVERLMRPTARPRKKVEVPTFGEFAETFMETYVAGNNKPSECDGKRKILNAYLLPVLENRRLNQVTVLDVETLKASLRSKPLKNKTINNVLTVMKTMFGWAEEMGVVEQSPRIRLLKVAESQVRFLDFEEYEALLSAAKDEPEWRAAILLGGDAGLRLGELRAVQWSDWERQIEKLRIERAFYKGTLGSTKGYSVRTIPLTMRLTRALEGIRHLRGPFILCQPGGEPLRLTQMRKVLPRLCRKAGIDVCSWHPLRHTFCSHLAMRGAPARTIQSLAGHCDLTTTLKYMHLTEGAAEQAIGLLEGRGKSVARTEKRRAND
jgi:integrase